jgi:hypothetical protein
MPISEKQGGTMNSASIPTDYLPFVYTERDCELFNKFHSDASFVRIPLHNSKRLIPGLPAKAKVWIDAEIDGLHQIAKASDLFANYLKDFAHSDKISDPAFQAKPEPGIVSEFVNAVLNACAVVKPKLISIPQLPITSDTSRNKINKELARATSKWAETRQQITLVLPVIFTHPTQYGKKTARNPKVTQVRQCFEASNAKGVWVVDSNLTDQDGAGTLDARLRALIEFHQELAVVLPGNPSIVAGPYWGLNLVLWARGIVRYPAVTLGNRYRYHLPGGRAQKASTRIALDPIKRLVVAKPELKHWLAESLKTIPTSDPAHVELRALLEKFNSLWQGDNRDQICNVYRRWLDSIAAAPMPGRALALYQQLSSAYVLGRTLGELPEEGLSRRPERVAQQLMLLCL